MKASHYQHALLGHKLPHYKNPWDILHAQGFLI